jgi:hypothetical protein
MNMIVVVMIFLNWRAGGLPLAVSGMRQACSQK